MYYLRSLVLCSIFILLMISSCFAHVRTAYEPEWDNAYSLSVQSIRANLGLCFVKYSTPTEDMYWFRMDKRKDEDKILPYATFIIDGIEYPVVALKNPDYRYLEAGQTLIDTSSLNNVVQHSNFRYFNLNKEIIQKLSTANEVKLKFDCVSRINRTTTIPDDLVLAVKEQIKMPYEDIKANWKPIDDSL